MTPPPRGVRVNIYCYRLSLPYKGARRPMIHGAHAMGDEQRSARACDNDCAKTFQRCPGCATSGVSVPQRVKANRWLDPGEQAPASIERLARLPKAFAHHQRATWKYGNSSALECVPRFAIRQAKQSQGLDCVEQRIAITAGGEVRVEVSVGSGRRGCIEWRCREPRCTRQCLQDCDAKRNKDLNM